MRIAHMFPTCSGQPKLASYMGLNTLIGGVRLIHTD
jgi:hypothetical protein